MILNYFLKSNEFKALAALCGCCLAFVGPYYAGLGNFSFSIYALVNPGVINVTTLVEHTKQFASCGLIDPTRNMLMDRVFIYHGTNDTRILPGHTISFNL